MQKTPRHVVGIKSLVDAVCGEHCRQWQRAARQAFGQTNKVGQDGGLLVRKHAAGTAKAGGNLIDHQMHVVVTAQRTHLIQVAGVMHGHACSALHQGLHDQRCGTGVVLLQPDL